MKLCSETISILKNFSTINKSIAFDGGNTIKTISPQRTVLAEATIAESINQPFAVYDLSKFLAILSMMPDADIELGTTSMKITSDDRTVKYAYCDRDMIEAPPAGKSIKVDSSAATFNLSRESFVELMKALGVLAVPNLVFLGKEGKLIGRVTQIDNRLSNSFDVSVGETAATFAAVINVDNLRLIPDDYKVTLSADGVVALFEAQSVPLKYWVALESTSSFSS